MRVRFYRVGVKSFERNERRDFESHKCENGGPYSYETKQFGSGLFLPYNVIEKGIDQGGFLNFKPEPLERIISSSDKVQFAVELITVVSGGKEKRAVEGEFGKHRSKITPLDEKAAPYAGPYSGEETYFNSHWVSMLSGGEPEVEIRERPQPIVPPKKKEQPPDDIEIPDDLGEL